MMGCSTDGVLTVCQPTTVDLLAIMTCPTCNRRRRFIGAFAVWYGVTWTCCGCGDSWSDGVRRPRPSARGWRPGAIAKARKRWREALPAADAKAAMWEMIEESR